MSDTPRTDAAVVSAEYIRREMDYYTHKFVIADHMRDVERELAAAIEQRDKARENALEEAAKVCEDGCAKRMGCEGLPPPQQEWERSYNNGRQDCARAIRALKECGK